MVVFFYGANTYESFSKAKQLRDRFVREVDPTGTSVTTLEGKELDVAHLRKVVLAPALFVKSRFVLIKNFFATKPQAALQEQLVALLSDYGELDSSNIVVFWDTVTKAEWGKKKNAPLFHYLSAQKFSHECLPPTAAYMKNVVEKKVADAHTTIERDALARLLHIVGMDSWRMVQEVEKLIAYADHRSITVQDVVRLVSYTEDSDVYALLDAYVAGKEDVALRIIDQLLTNQDSVYSILNTLKWHIQAVGLLVSALRNGVIADNELVRVTGLHSFVVKKNKRYAAAMSEQQLALVYQKILELELSVRKQTASAAVLFSHFITSTIYTS